MSQDSKGGAAFNPFLGLDWSAPAWGERDQLGAGNLLNQRTVLRAAGLIRSGEIVKLGYPYDAQTPRGGDRTFSFALTGQPSGGPLGERDRGLWNDDVYSGTFGQMGTHMDALGHFGCQCGHAGDAAAYLFYNRTKLPDLWSPGGLTQLGIEYAPAFFTRGILFDVEGLKRRPLEPGEEISIEDLEACLARQNLPADTLSPGDVVLIRTGHAAARWHDPDYYVAAPGIGIDAATW